jgi:sugar phosphate isomerase/epimerase
MRPQYDSHATRQATSPIARQPSSIRHGSDIRLSQDRRYSGSRMRGPIDLAQSGEGPAMSDLPVIGAAMTIATYETHYDFMRELPRDIEIQDFFDASLLNGDWASVAAHARNLLDGHEGRIGIHGPFWGFNIASQDPDVRAIVRKRFHQGLDVCEAVGANQMVIHSPYSTWDYNNLDNLPNARASVVERTHDAIGEIVKRAEDMGCVLVVENIEDVDPHARVELVKSFQSEAIAVSIDTGHACYAHGSTGAPPVDYYVGAAGNLLQHVHLQDADGYADRHWSLGEGIIRWHPVFAALGTLTSNPRLIVEIRDKTKIPDSVAYLQSLGLGQ